MGVEVENQNQGEVGKEHRGVPSAESKATPELKADPLFAPAPWTLKHYCKHTFSVLANDEVIAVVGDCAKRLEYVEANARLIFAAPTLYDTLAKMAGTDDCCCTCSDENCCRVVGEWCVGCEARAAIALANGQAASEVKG